LGDWEYGVLVPKKAYPKAKAAIRAIELDDTLIEGHASLAFLGMFDWDLQSAEKEFDGPSSLTLVTQRPINGMPGI
jgi:hypothetical protein